MVRLFHDWVFLADRSGANTKQLSISHGGQRFMVSLAENGSGLNLTVCPTIGNNCPVQGKNTYTSLRFKQGFDHRLSTIGKSLRFTNPHSKANNKSK